MIRKEGELMHYRVGDVVEGIVTGIQPYGAFVYLDSNHKGLIHISEISERYVKDVSYFVKMNERVCVKILDVDDEGEHLKLSLKAVQNNKSRFRRYQRSVTPIPPMVIGFTSLAEKLDGWIDDASR